MKPFSKLLISLVCGVVALVMVGGYTMALSGSADARRAAALKSFTGDVKGDVVKVVVARNDLAVGTKIAAEDVVVKEWVFQLLPVGASDNASSVVGQEVKSLILAGEPVSTARLGDSGRMVLSIPDGFSAVSIRSEDVLAVGGAVRSGSKVDIYESTSEGGVRVLRENVLVLATSADAGADAAGLVGGSTTITWVTIAVPSGEVGQVVRAMNNNLTLVLRSGAAPAASAASEPTSPAVP